MRGDKEKKRKPSFSLFFLMIFFANRVKRNEMNIHLFNNNVVKGGVFPDVSFSLLYLI
jgi:hypothetical protein